MEAQRMKQKGDNLEVEERRTHRENVAEHLRVDEVRFRQRQKDEMLQLCEQIRDGAKRIELMRENSRQM